MRLKLEKKALNHHPFQIQTREFLHFKICLNTVLYKVSNVTQFWDHQEVAWDVLVGGTKDMQYQTAT
jgi:hypothetical protein